jgi:hypothetical protein
MFIFFLSGFIGGTIRGIVGIIKYTLSYKDVQIRWWYFGGVTVISGLIGLAVAWTILELGLSFGGVEGLSPAIALITGYAGGDFLENVFKVLMKKPVLFN